jgi:hypothetical protein
MKDWYKKEFFFRITVEGAGESKRSGKFMRHDGVVAFRLEAFQNE